MSTTMPNPDRQQQDNTPQWLQWLLTLGQPQGGNVPSTTHTSSSTGTPVTAPRTGSGYNTFTPAGTPVSQMPNRSWEELLQEFYAEINKPLDMKDPRVAAIVNGAYGRATADATARGIGGPMAVSGAQQSYIGAAAGLDQNRRAMGLSALQAGLQGDIANRGLSLQNARQQYDADFQRWLAQAQLGQAQGSGWGSTIGGLVGGGLGLAASFIPGAQPLAPVLIAGGAQAGSQIGAGIGGGSYNPGAPPTYNPARGLSPNNNRVV